MNGVGREDRNRAIIARAEQQPDLTLEQIGQEFSLSTGMVSLLLRGKRGIGKRGRPRNRDKMDVELDAISRVLGILGSLEEEQAVRVLQYVLKRFGVPEVMR